MGPFALSAPSPSASARAPLLATAAAALLFVAWDATGLDLALARLAGNGHGFALRDHWLFSQVLHDGLHRAAFALALLLCLVVWWPGPLAGVPQTRRLQWAVSTLAAALAVALLKHTSHTSCPWDLAEFGGVARHLSHWSAAVDGGPGRCFPAGHASSGFAFAGGWFALRRDRPKAARAVLAASLAAGLAMGLAQQWRGAHFLSHTLWSGWVCWCTAFAIDAAWPRRCP